MERTRRRLFTFAITAGALLVILAAAASGLFQLAVQAVPGYRDDVERYVGDLTGRPIRIDALGLTWRYYYPSLELVGVALLSEEGGTPVIEAERLRLGFALGRLVRGDYAPNRLELHGLSLDARIAPDGSLSVQDLPVGGDEGSTEALRPLTRFSSIRLERCRLNLRDDRRGRDTLSFGLTQARFDSGLLGHRVRAEIVLPPVLGETARLDAGFEGDLLAPAEWSGTAELELEGLVPATWAAPYLVRGTTLEAEGVRLRLGAEFEGRRVDSIEARLRSGPVRAARARHEAALGALDVRARIERRDDGWQARVEPLTVAGAHGAWAPSTAEVRATEADGEPTAWEARVGYLQLGDLAPWLQLVRAPAAFAGLSQASGEVRDLELRVAGAGDGLRQPRERCRRARSRRASPGCAVKSPATRPAAAPCCSRARPSSSCRAGSRCPRSRSRSWKARWTGGGSRRAGAWACPRSAGSCWARAARAACRWSCRRAAARPRSTSRRSSRPRTSRASSR
jgi:uncharacterized protein YhdP